jgi:glycosyltransferase involved in cell wall biosynthesis
MSRNLCFFLLFISALFSLEPPVKRERPESLKVSIIIPCHYSHFQFLENLLRSYQSQLNATDEVVISLSGVDRLEQRVLNLFERRAWPFCMKLIKTCGPKLASENRNIACSHSTGDLLICQDADDLPHRHRVKIIRQLFENFKINLLLHQYEFQVISQSNSILPAQAVSKCFIFKEWAEHEIAYYVQHGCPALMRSVWESIRWEEDPQKLEDTWFNNRVFYAFPDIAILFIPLIAYRPQYSALHVR